jgi:hypothetical protein
MRVPNWMKRVHGFAFASLISGACLTLPLGRSVAQAYEFDMQGTIGVAVPVGNLSDTSDPGLGLGFGLTRWVNKWVGFHLGIAANMLNAKGAGPDLTLWHYNAGIEGDLINPSTSKFRLHANLGLGATTTSANSNSSTDFTINGGPNLEYSFGERLNGLVGAQLYVVLASDTEVVLPVYVGFRYALSE